MTDRERGQVLPLYFQGLGHALNDITSSVGGASLLFGLPVSCYYFWLGSCGGRGGGEVCVCALARVRGWVCACVCVYEAAHLTVI